MKNSLLSLANITSLTGLDIIKPKRYGKSYEEYGPDDISLHIRSRKESGNKLLPRLYRKSNTSIFNNFRESSKSFDTYLDGKSKYVLCYLPDIHNELRDIENNNPGSGMQRRMSFSIELALLLDLLAVNNRIIFAPSNKNVIYQTEAENTLHNFSDFENNDELFHAMNIASLGLQMKKYSTSIVLKEIALLDLLFIGLNSRLCLTSDFILASLLKSLGVTTVLFCTELERSFWSQSCVSSYPTSYHAFTFEDCLSFIRNFSEMFNIHDIDEHPFANETNADSLTY